MDRDTVRPVVLALWCVLAIGLAAATLNSAVETDESGGFGTGPTDSDVGVPNGGGGGLGSNNSGSVGGMSVPFDGTCYPILDTWWAILLLLGGFALGGYVAYRRLGGLGVIAYAGPVGIPLLLVHALLTGCAEPGGDRSSSFLPPVNETGLLPDGGSGAPGSGEGVAITDPSVLMMVGLGVALIAAVALLFNSSSGDDPDAEESFAESESSGDVAAVGRAAGAAADRIESATDVDNEVYRAWREMTDHLDVSNPRTSTPAEFAAAAVEAGMAREDVQELTAVFEAVRYGGEAPTAEREERAVAALRRIQHEYAEADADANAEGDR